MDDDSTRPLPTLRSSPYPVSRLAPAFSLAHIGEDLERASLLLGAVHRARLDVIADQIRHLQEEAERILDKARLDAALHGVEIRFQRRVGGVYHLYTRPNRTHYMSMLSPEEWGEPPDEFMGSYRLEIDQSWTRVDLTSGSPQTA